MAACRPYRTETAPLKRHSKSTELHLRQTPAAVPHPANPYVDSLTRQKNMVLHSSQKDKSKTVLIGSLAAVILVLVVCSVGVLCWISAKTGPTMPVQEIAVERTDNQETVKPAEDKKEGKQNPEFAVEQEPAHQKTAGKAVEQTAESKVPQEVDEKENQRRLAEQKAPREKTEKENRKEAIADARDRIATEYCSRIWMFAPEKKFYDEQGQSIELMDILHGSEKVIALYIRVDNKDNKCPVNENFCEEQVQNKNPLLSQQSSFNYRFEVKYRQEKSDRKSVTLVNMEKECTLYKIAALRIGAEGVSDRIVPLLYDFQSSNEDSKITVKPVLFLQEKEDQFMVRFDNGKIVWEYTLREGTETKLPQNGNFKLKDDKNNLLALYRRGNVLTCNLPFDDFEFRDKIQKLKMTKANLQCRNQCKTFFKQKEADYLAAQEKNNKPQSNKGSKHKDKKEKKQKQSENAPIFVCLVCKKWRFFEKVFR